MGKGKREKGKRGRGGICDATFPLAIQSEFLDFGFALVDFKLVMG